MKQKINILLGLLLFIIPASLFIPSCTTEESNPVSATNVELLSGDEQIGDAGTVLPIPIEVLVNDQNGKPFVGATVNFKVEEGSVSKASTITDANGKASVSWTPGYDKSPQKLLVEAFKADGLTYISGSPIFVTANLEADNIELVTGGDQTGFAENRLKQAIELVVKYPNGDVFAEGATIYFTVSEGFVLETSAITDENGTVSTEWTLGTSVGTQTLNITAFKEDGTTALSSSPITVNANALYNKITDYDGNNYKIVEIGEQIWMKENLKVTHYSEGTSIPYVTDDTEWANLGDNETDKAFCYYNNNANGEKDIYGALYTWAAAMNGAASSWSVPSGVQGVCPTGWHLPGEMEWRKLMEYLGMGEYTQATSGWFGANIGGSMKTSGTTFWDSPNTGATNRTEFSALPGGRRMRDTGLFDEMGETGVWFGATDYGYSAGQDNIAGIIRILNYDKSEIGRSWSSKSNGFSVRCIKD